MQIPFYEIALKRELARRFEANPLYSLRSFSKQTNINVATLSRILSRKELPSLRTAKKIAEFIYQDDSSQVNFIKSVAQTRKSHGLKKFAIEDENRHETVNLTQESFKIISDIIHYAILDLIDTEGFRADSRWIGRRLGITALEADLAISRLLDLNLMKRDGDKFIKIHTHLAIDDLDKTSKAQKMHQRQVLNKAKESLQTDPIELRSMNSMTLAIEPEKLPLAKQLIQEFMDKLSESLETGHKTEVYGLGINLFPLTKRGVIR